MTPARKHRHEFSAIGWTFGPFGRQDVHVHSCYAGCWTGALPEDACQRVLIAPGRECDGEPASHHRETLTA